MREIKSREEYAKEINFGKHPVLMIDMNQKAFMDEIYDGGKVRVDFGYFGNGERHLGNGEFKYYKKENKFYVASYGIMISNRFSYEDAMECAEYGNSPIINEGDEVVIVVHNSEERSVKCYIAKAVNKRKFCSTMIEFE